MSHFSLLGGGPRVVVSIAAFHARVRGSVPGLGGLKETRNVSSPSTCENPYFESCVWRTVSSQSSHHPREVLLPQFSLYVHKGGLKPDSFHFFSSSFSCIVCRCIVSHYSLFFRSRLCLPKNKGTRFHPELRLFIRRYNY